MGKLLPAILTLLLFVSCQSESRNKTIDQAFPQEVELITPNGAPIQTRVALTWKDQQQGLSGVQPEDFSDEQGVMFFNLEDDERNFWMPDTYFDLDLFYLDQTLKIIDIVRKLPHYRGRANEDLIPRARSVWSRHVLEMKSGSKTATSLKIGDQLKWKSPVSLEVAEQIGKKIVP